MKLLKLFVTCMVALPVFALITTPKNIQFVRVWEGAVPPADETPRDKLLGGLLSPDFDQESCLSRYQSSFYRKTSPHLPSPYLLSRLRSYEELHKQCGPNSQSYNEALELLSANRSSSSSYDQKDKRNASSSSCNYLVFMARDGVGNRVLGIASAFLYALLTNRVLLVDQGNDLADLFCEPFPESSWFLPKRSPVDSQWGFYHGLTLGDIIRKNNNSMPSAESLPAHLHIFLGHAAKDHDKLFYCDEYQELIKNVPWLMMGTNNYLVPGLFLIPSLEKELIRLFPRKDTVFHHVGRYLFHPTNAVWGIITRFYDAYLAQARERIGIQIRNFDFDHQTFESRMDQILACTQNQNLLPKVSLTETVIRRSPSRGQPGKAVVMVSLSSNYSEAAKRLYLEHPTVDGEVVGIYQPSHEDSQRRRDRMHDRKALAEIYLLSLCDVLVTSPWSTFGYVAHGLAGVEPWIIYKPETTGPGVVKEFFRHREQNMTAHSEPCRRGMSLEPCFHTPPVCKNPHVCKCKSMPKIYEESLGPYVKPCEDLSWGIKLFDSGSD